MPEIIERRTAVLEEEGGKGQPSLRASLEWTWELDRKKGISTSSRLVASPTKTAGSVPFPKLGKFKKNKCRIMGKVVGR